MSSQWVNQQWDVMRLISVLFPIMVLYFLPDNVHYVVAVEVNMDLHQTQEVRNLLGCIFFCQ